MPAPSYFWGAKMEKKITLSELREMLQDIDLSDDEIAQYLVEKSDGTAFARVLSDQF